MDTKKPSQKEEMHDVSDAVCPATVEKVKMEKEIGGFENRAEPTRYGDWEVNGRCSDF